MRLSRWAALPVLLNVFLTCSTDGRAEHAIAMHGEPRYPAGFGHFDYVDPQAPKGGSLRMARLGSFDTLNPFVVIGVPADGLRLTVQGLMARAMDEPFTLYPQVAASVSTDDRQSFVEFAIEPTARWHDGSQVTAADVLFSYRTLRERGRPNHRAFYGQVVEAEAVDAMTVRYHIDGRNRELPLLLGLMPVLQEAEFAGREFRGPSLTPLQGSGPYRIESVDPGRGIVYRRIPGHWTEALASGRGRHNFDIVAYDYYRDDATRLAAFRSGGYDLREEPSPQAWAESYDFPAAARGEVKLEEFRHGRPSGLYGIVTNTRRPMFADRATRAALAHALDFEWLNRTYFHGAYRRTDSMYANSRMAPAGPPGEAELAILQPFRDEVPAAVFGPPYRPPGDGMDRRERLLAAREGLLRAGWAVRDGRMVDGKSGAPFRFEIMLASRAEERVALHRAEQLGRLGIAVEVRLVDSSQYQQRLDAFDYDAIFFDWFQSLSPGNEQAFYWSSESAGQPGSRNYAGVSSPAVDAAVQALLAARERPQLEAAAAALDRLLIWGHYAIPLYHLPVDRLAYWDRFGPPAPTPLYGYQIDTWWARP